MDFNLIHHRGRVMKATTLKGETVERHESLFVPEWGALVPCADYDEHFIYATNAPEQSAYMCTCGSPAVVVNPERGAGRMFVCMFHASNGTHTTSYVNLKDFPNVAGETIEVKEGKGRWV